MVMVGARDKSPLVVRGGGTVGRPLVLARLPGLGVTAAEGVVAILHGQDVALLLSVFTLGLDGQATAR